MLCQTGGVESAPRTYRGVGAEERKARRRALLLDAGLDLLGTQGWQQTTMTAVCQRAKLTERYFYESFADLEELLVAVFERVAAEAAEVVLAASESGEADARPRARAAVAAFVELMTDDPRKGRVAFVEAFGSEALMRRRFETITAFASLLGDQARGFYGTRPEADRLVNLTSFVMVGGMAEALIAWLGGSIKTSRDELIDDLTDILVATGEWAVQIGRRR